jgi:hypothetical protein
MHPESEPTPVLNPDDLFAAEYAYIADTVFQANEDRSRIASFYFISVGSIVAAILGTQFAEDNLKSVALAFSVLFIFLTILGTLTIAQLARLRAAWYESVQAMNQLKEFYIAAHPGIAPAFKWRGNTIPPTDKPFSIANLIAIEVALLGAVTTAVAVYFLILALSVTFPSWGWMPIVVSFFLGSGLQLWCYKRLLNRKKPVNEGSK